jgi:hypothetical protein
MALFPGAHLQVSVRAREIRNEAREHSKRERGRVKEGHEGMCQTWIERESDYGIEEGF